jgi:hypothetical protein
MRATKGSAVGVQNGKNNHCGNEIVVLLLSSCERFQCWSGNRVCVDEQKARQVKARAGTLNFHSHQMVEAGGVGIFGCIENT